MIGRLRFRLWTLWLRAALRRHGGGALVLRAAPTVRCDGWPHVRVDPRGVRLTLELGEHVSLGRDLNLDLRGACALRLGEAVYLQHAVRIHLRDGGRVAVGARSHVRDGAVLKSDGELTIGEDVTIGFHDVLSCTERIAVGDRTGLGERVTVIDADHSPDGSPSHYLGRPLRTSPIAVGTNVLVSANVVILRGARVGADAVLAAGAVVREGEHAGGWVHGGAPARPLRELPGAARSRPR